MQEKSNPRALAIELRLFCKSLIFATWYLPIYEDQYCLHE